MEQMKIKGVTPIEQLIVILVLAIIVFMFISNVLNFINIANKTKYNNDVQKLHTAAIGVMVTNSEEVNSAKKLYAFKGEELSIFLDNTVTYNEKFSLNTNENLVMVDEKTAMAIYYYPNFNIKKDRSKKYSIMFPDYYYNPIDYEAYKGESIFLIISMPVNSEGTINTSLRRCTVVTN
ncbi:MAG: hypothetical protein ACK5LT_03225 [Lachnospirales bacterium]